MEGIITNIVFRKASISEEEKLVKIERVFKCDHSKAQEILELISSGMAIEVKDFSYTSAISFGIECTFLTYEQIRIMEGLKQKEIEEKRERELKEQEAENWFNTLQPHEKEYVQILGYTKFRVFAVG